MSAAIPSSVFSFLKALKNNNHRDWMQENKKEYQANEKTLKEVYAEIEAGLNRNDEISKVKVFRINRDIRFSNDKTPYNTHRSVSFSRAGAHRRGGYYLRIEPGNTMIAGGFFGPEPADLLRIRKEFEMDAGPIREIIAAPNFKKEYGNFVQEYAVKTAPKGFRKDDPNIDLIRLKSFFVVHNVSDKQAMASNFTDYVLHRYELLRPFFDYMSEVLTTDLNGVSLLK